VWVASEPERGRQVKETVSGSVEPDDARGMGARATHMHAASLESPVADRSPRGPLALAAVLVFGAAATLWSIGRTSAAIDFYQYWVWPQVAARGDVPNLFDWDVGQTFGEEFIRRAETTPGAVRQQAAANVRRRLQVYSTPALHAAFTPLARLSYERAWLVFRVVVMAAAVAAFALLGRVLGFAPLAIAAAFAFAAFTMQGVRTDVRVGNVNLLQLLLIAAYAALAARDGWRPAAAAGALQGIAVCLKPSFALVPVLVVAAEALRGRRREAGGQLAGVAAGLACGLAAGMWSSGTVWAWHQWAAGMTSMRAEEFPLAAGNYSATRLVLGGRAPAAAAPITAVLAAAVLVAVARAGRRSGADATVPLRVAGLACAATLLASPLVWMHYAVLALPLGLALLRPGAPAWANAAGAVALAAVAVDPWTAALGVADPARQAAGLAAGLALLFAAGTADLARTQVA
jgi:hypothetical protein